MEDRKNKGGRPEGSMNKLAREARQMAERTGLLPHEILLRLARGNAVEADKSIDPVTGQPQRHWLFPDLETIKDAAKAAAPYFAPKISTVEVIQGVSDHELDRIIALAASEAGVSLSPGGEGEEGQTTDTADGDGEGQQAGTGRKRTRVDPRNL